MMDLGFLPGDGVYLYTQSLSSLHKEEEKLVSHGSHHWSWNRLDCVKKIYLHKKSNIHWEGTVRTLL
jgi:hypothetical protein